MATENLPTQQQQALSVRAYLFDDNTKDKLQVALPKWLSVDRLLRVAYTAILKNPQLLECTKESLLGAVMQCAQLGLEPVLNRAHLVPYRNNKKQGNPLECQFQPGYAGLVDLGRRSGDISNVTAHVVYENDEFELLYGTDEHLTHKPALNGDRGKIVGVYAVWFYKDGTKSPHFLPLGDCYKYHRARSMSYLASVKYKNDKSPWISDEPTMLRKTAVKASSKLQSLSVEFMSAVELDNQAETGKPQRGFFLDATAHGAIDTPPPFFDSTIPDGTGEKMLEAFLQLCADQFNKTVDEVKAEAAQDPGFWDQYQKWAETQGATDKTLWDEGKKPRGAGYGDWVKENIVRIKEAPQEIQDKLQARWIGFYEEPWPLEAKNGEVPKKDDDADWNGLHYECPDMDGNPIAKMKCKTCSKLDGCPTPFKPGEVKA